MSDSRNFRTIAAWSFCPNVTSTSAPSAKKSKTLEALVYEPGSKSPGTDGALTSLHFVFPTLP